MPIDDKIKLKMTFDHRSHCSSSSSSSSFISRHDRFFSVWRSTKTNRELVYVDCHRKTFFSLGFSQSSSGETSNPRNSSATHSDKKQSREMKFDPSIDERRNEKFAQLLVLVSVVFERQSIVVLFSRVIVESTSETKQKRSPTVTRTISTRSSFVRQSSLAADIVCQRLNQNSVDRQFDSTNKVARKEEPETGRFLSSKVELARTEITTKNKRRHWFNPLPPNWLCFIRELVFQSEFPLKSSLKKISIKIIFNAKLFRRDFEPNFIARREVTRCQKTLSRVFVSLISSTDGEFISRSKRTRFRSLNVNSTEQSTIEDSSSRKTSLSICFHRTFVPSDEQTFQWPIERRIDRAHSICRQSLTANVARLKCLVFCWSSRFISKKRSFSKARK